MIDALKISLIVTAAGKGTRFSDATNKLLLDCEGVPLIIRTLRRLLVDFSPYEIILTVHRSDLDDMARLMEAYGFSQQILLVVGGETRRESVERGFHALKLCDVVMIHDGARPFISAAVMTRLREAASVSVAVVPGIEIVDTVKRVDDNDTVIETIPRSELRRIQTPQLFPYTQLKRAYEQHLAPDATDEAMVMEAMGVPVKVVVGDPQNRKITVPEDWQL